MTGYILSILGIVCAGIFMDAIIPSGSISKYIKGIYAIFVVAVIINPVYKFINKTKDFNFTYSEHETNQSLLEYIYSKQVKSLEDDIENLLRDNGFDKVDIILNFSIKDDELIYSSCEINLKNLVISTDKQHINKYEFIREVVKENTSLSNEEIIFNEWR